MRATCLLFGVRLDDLGTYALPWSDLWALIDWAPADSPIRRALEPELAAWSTGTQVSSVLADIYDALAGANWQRGGGRRSRPKPYPRPGDKAKQKFGRRKMKLGEARAWLAKRRRGLPG